MNLSLRQFVKVLMLRHSHHAHWCALKLSRILSEPCKLCYDYLCIISAQLIREHLGERGFPVVSCEHLHGSVQSSQEMDWESDRDKVIAGIGKLKQLGGFTSVKACVAMAWFAWFVEVKLAHWGWPTLSWVQKEPIVCQATHTLRDRRITIVMVCHGSPTNANAKF